MGITMIEKSLLYIFAKKHEVMEMEYELSK